MINTHYHGDHTGGNASFHKDGATIVAAGQHPRPPCRRHAQRHHRRKDRRPACRRRAERNLCRRRARRSRSAAARRCSPRLQRPHRRRHLGLFPRRQCARTGDTFGNRTAISRIDFANGGDIRGMIRASSLHQGRQRQHQDRARPWPARRIRPDVATYIAMVKTARERIEKLVQRRQDRGRSAGGEAAGRPRQDLGRQPTGCRQLRQAGLQFVQTFIVAADRKPPGRSIIAGTSGPGNHFCNVCARLKARNPPNAVRSVSLSASEFVRPVRTQS